MSTLVRARLVMASVLVAVLAFEVYVLFVRRSGETAYRPRAADTSLSPAIGGTVTLAQTFVMQVEDLQAISVYAHPAGAAPSGTAELVLSSERYEQPIARHRIAAAEMASTVPFTWTLPRIAQATGQTFTLHISVPDATPGRGLRFEIGLPLYAGGELVIDNRSFWGDLKFETRAARARLFTTLSQLRTQMPRVVRTDAFLIIAAIVFNWAVVTLAAGLLRGGGASEDPRP